MATVPGTPMDDSAFGGIPKELRPTQADFMIAAAMHAEQTKLAGDVIPFIASDPGEEMTTQQFRQFITPGGGADIARTKTVLSRALGMPGAKVLPMTPKDK